MKLAYPEITEWYGYGILSGAAFTISYSFFGLFGGLLSDNYNRKMVACLAAILWSLCTLFTGYLNSFVLMYIFRFGLGIFESALNPCAYSIIADYFHPSVRGRANSIFSLGVYLGGAMSSISVIIISNYGWRYAYELIGYVGLGSAVVAFIFLREPPRGKFEVKVEAELGDIKNGQEKKASPIS